jgi:mRNA interferase MazF
MKAKKYEVWLANLDPKYGTETGKTRPVLIVQTDILNNVHPSTIICPLTTNTHPGSQILRQNFDRMMKATDFPEESKEAVKQSLKKLPHEKQKN